MNAVGYYAARDLASLRNHAYWEYCERQWKHSKPAAYPSFQEWRKASERCSEQVLDECQMREEKRRLIKLSRRVGPRTLRKAVERYLEWEIFGYWVRTALESGCPLPASVEGAVRQRCPNFLEADAAAHAANPEEEPHCRFNRMIKWVEDHEFTDAKTRGWFDVLLHRRVCIRVTPESSITGATGKRNGRELPPLNTRLSRFGKKPSTAIPSSGTTDSDL